jgi:hypothetical protein
MDLRGTGYGGMGWIVLAQERDQWRYLVNTIMNLWNILESLHNWQLLRKAQLQRISWLWNS